MPAPAEPDAARAGRVRAIRNSALWATAGDALGWITELSRGSAGVAHRAGVAEVVEPVNWKRVIGGRTGVRVDLPAGTYSDDTQLRLAVCRSIRGDGSFDAETFAKIEVTVWPTYALGGGLGTKAAAANLAKRSVNWFSNFFEANGQSYVKGGGNGGAMRIQPHVWVSSKSTDEMLLNVLRDVLVTHGHPHGFCGAIFHALCLNHVLLHATIPGPAEWQGFVERFADVPRLIAHDPQLAAFWQSAWESGAGTSLIAAMKLMREEADEDLRNVERALALEEPSTYHQILDILGCLSPQFRGSGFKTALAAAALSKLHGGRTPETALVQAANELESDTDTIATMAGALLGASAAHEPNWAVQDRDYIVEEARRLACISLGEPQDSFMYPDLGHWNPPSKQTASIGKHAGDLAIAGLGQLSSQSDEYRSGEAIWQWFSLPFGQTILAKRRANGVTELVPSQLPGARQPAPSALRANPLTQPRKHEAQSSLPLEQAAAATPPEPKELDGRLVQNSRRESLDNWTDAAIQSDFDDLTLGRLLNRCIERSESVDAAVAFAAIVAKAKLTRQRRRR